ncbi:MAG: ABC transporter ATP-binding protein [Coprobacillus sp.]|nr:ABC transporter ATP-binding protein [Coprobacillus sp.]
MAQVVVDNLSKIYNQGQSNEIVALDNISFTAEKGEFIVILGASGAGKTTLLNLLGGMDNATSGSYKIDDVEVTSLSDSELTKVRRDDIGFVFQFYNLMPNLTAYENVMIAELVAHGDGSRSDTVLEQVELKERRNNFPSELSGGEQQRVSIARAIVKNPRLLLCDEPTGALDSKTGASIIKLLKKINKENDTTVIVVTHNANIAQVADRVIRIADGKIIEDSFNEIVKDPEEIDW